MPASQQWRNIVSQYGVAFVCLAQQTWRNIKQTMSRNDIFLARSNRMAQTHVAVT